MKRATLFFLIVIIIGSIAIGLAGMLLGWLRTKENEKVKELSSDAVKLTETIRFAGDSWIGYVIFRSPQFRTLLEAEGIGFQYTDDAADYPARMAKLAAGEHDAIVTSLDAWLLNGAAVDYPGVVAFVVDESKGGDGIVAAKKSGVLGDLAKPGNRIAFTPNSPSEFFLRAVATHFDLTALRAPGPWRVEANGSSEALNLLQAGEVDAAVLWEPDLSTAAALDGFSPLITTERTKGLIIDVCVLSRSFVVNKPAQAEALVRAYFQALRYYQAQPEAFEQLAAADAKVSREKAKIMLEGVAFTSLNGNALQWFGIGPDDVAREQLLASIDSTQIILRETGLLDGDPLKGQPRSIINSSLIEKALSAPASRATEGVFGDAPDPTPASQQFIALSDEQWSKLPLVGRLKTRPIYFQASTSLLALDGKRGIDQVLADLAHYPSFRLVVRGHSKSEGEEKENLELSRQRAEAVVSYLVRVHDLPVERLRAEGVGSREPLTQEEGESFRRWQGRLPRVEFWLVQDL